MNLEEMNNHFQYRKKKKIDIIRYFKKYRNPYQKNIDYYKTIEKIKEDTFIERENAEKK